MKDGKMSRSKAGRIGWEKTRIKREERIRLLRIEYEKEGKRCLCGELIPYEKRKNDFCNHSCAAKKNNLGVRRHGNSPGVCLFCGKDLSRSDRMFCNNHCMKEFQYQEFIRGWKLGNIDGMVNHGLGTSRYIHRWLRENFGVKCVICKNTEWMGKPIPLTLDHTDGNYKNNTPENLRLVCGNCGMLLPTFTGRNRGKGRLARKQWDQKNFRVMGE